MAKAKHWSIKVSEDQIRPAGSARYLNQAKAVLGPFSNKHSKEKGCLCEKCAEGHIIELARKYNTLRYRMKGAPRVGQIIKRIQKVAQQSRQLAASLSQLDDYSRRWLMKPPNYSFRNQGDVPPRKPQVFNKLPPSSTTSPGDGALVAELLELSTYADAMALNFDDWRLFETPFLIHDVGGNTNIVTQWFGTPAELIVFGAYRIFLQFKDVGPRKTENGPFHRLVNDVHAFATGSEKGQAHLFEVMKNKIGPNGKLKVAKMKPLDKKLQGIILKNKSGLPTATK